jgi:hypothetical protein
MVIYVGDSGRGGGDVVSRVTGTHCAGNVEGSALRRHVAERMGYPILRTKRPGGSTKVRLDLLDPRIGEEKVSNYIRSGAWKYVVCRDYEEAHDFQGFVIERLHPLLNVHRPAWRTEREPRYQALLDRLLSAPAVPCGELRGKPTGPGVYVLYHQLEPEEATTAGHSSEPAGPRP